MAKFPEPDAEWIEAIGPQVRSLPQNSRWFRIYFAGGAHPAEWNTFRHYGPVATARFDHHLPPPAPQARHVIYAARIAPIALAEVFQDRRHIGFEGQPRLASFRLAREVKVLDLMSTWPTRAGGSQAIASGPRQRSQRWARVIANVFGDVEGLIYRSSMFGGDEALALWDCSDALPDAPELDLQLADPRLASALQRVAEDIGYAVTPEPTA